MGCFLATMSTFAVRMVPVSPLPTSKLFVPPPPGWVVSSGPGAGSKATVDDQKCSGISHPSSASTAAAAAGGGGRRCCQDRVVVGHVVWKGFREKTEEPSSLFVPKVLVRGILGVLLVLGGHHQHPDWGGLWDKERRWGQRQG